MNGEMSNMVPFNRALGNRNVAGDFHRPYEGRLPFNRAIFIAPVRRRGRIWGENWVGG